MNVLDALKSINNYPIPTITVTVVAGGRLLDVAAEADETMLCSPQFMLAKAELLQWLSMAPNVSQGGQSYSFSSEERQRLRRQADAIFAQYDDETSGAKVKYGYKGSRL